MSGASGIEETDQFKVQIPLRTSRGTAGVAIPLEMGGVSLENPGENRAKSLETLKKAEVLVGKSSINLADLFSCTV